MTPEAPPALGGPPDPRGGGPLPRWVDVLTRDRFGKAMLAAVGAAPTGVVFADPRLPDCPIVYANPAFLRLTGYDLTEVLGRNCRFLQGKDSDPAAVFQLRQALAEARPVLLRLVNYRRDGKRFENELHIMPVLGEDGRPTLFVGIQNDVSARLRAEREVERARKEARRISARTSDFLAFMSHEVRTPLNGVMGTLSLLLDTSLDAEQRAYAETTRRCGESLLSTVNEILDLSRIEAGRLSLERIPFALADPVREVLALLGPASAEKGLVLTASIDPSLPARLMGDPKRLRQVLLNLGDNAVKFTASGTVTLRLSGAGTQAAPLLRAEVEDSGLGIPPPVQARLFRRFAQADASVARRHGGSGLGLMICKRLVALMGGRIGVESAPNQGSTFWFELPLRAAPRAAPLPPAPAVLHPPAVAAPPAARSRILLAEDGEANQLVAAAILRKAGHAVELASDGEEAVAAARRGDLDLVLMDVRMPRLDGFAATAQIRALPAPAGQVPILALTASAMPGDAARCLAAGMNGHLAKPVDRAALLAAVARMLEAHPPRPRAAPVPDQPGHGAELVDQQTLEELRRAVGPGRLPALLAVFATETRARLLRMAKGTPPLSLIEAEAHGLASAAGTFGATALRLAAAELEAAARVGDEARARRLLAGIGPLATRSLADYPVPVDTDH